MIGVLVAIKTLLEIDAVGTCLSTLDAGLNIFNLFKIAKAGFKKDSLEYQTICALETSLEESCEKLGWEHDDLAVSQVFDNDTSLIGITVSKEGLGKLFSKLVGMEIEDSALDVIVDCFDKSVANNDKLHRYLDQKWKRYIDAGGTLQTEQDTKLRKYLAEVLKQKRNSHPSFQLLEADEIDNRLYPNIKEHRQIEPRGNVHADDGAEKGSCPIWKIIRDSWSASEHRNVVIMGEGGIGKTVALFSIVRMPDGLIPVPALYIPMYELVDKNGRVLELEDYISKKYRRYSDRIDAIATEIWTERPWLLILLDGFNEIPFSLRRDALDVVNEWYESHPGAQVIAVSRPMDGLNLTQELAGDPLSVELAPLDERTVRAYLKEAKRRSPAKGAPVWEDLRYPLFLNLYVKTYKLAKNSPAGYPLDVKKTDSGGALIWNFLQRELLRHKADKNEKAENWILRCAVSNEYILPYLAYRMVSEHRMDISYKQADRWIRDALDCFDSEKLPKHLTKIWDKFNQNHGHAPEKDMSSLDVWRDTVLRDSGILVPLVKRNNKSRASSGNYVFMHQHFRDCLAGLHLVNQAETAGEDELPEVWKQGQNHLALDYAAELIDEKTIDRLWEINRKNQQYDSPGYVKDHSGTFALLELQKRRRPMPEDLDFSGMDLQDVSLTRYMGIGNSAMFLFRDAHFSCGLKLDQSTFRSEGHFSRITCLRLLPDGRVVSGSYDCSLCVWDPLMGQCLKVLKGHTDRVSCISVLTDNRIVSGSHDGSLRVWDLSAGQCLKILKGHEDKIECVEVLPDGRVVSGSYDSSLRVWNPSTGQCLQVLEGHGSRVTCMAVLPDGCVVSGSDDDSLRVWDPTTGQCLRILKGHGKWVTCIAVLPEGRIVSGMFNGVLCMWDPSSGECLKVLRKHGGWVTDIVVLPDGRFVSYSGDGHLRVWDPSSGASPKVLWVRESISCMAVLEDGHIVGGTYHGSLYVWDLSSGQCLQSFEEYGSAVSCIEVLPDGCVVSGSDDGSLCVWDSLSGRCLQSLEGHGAKVNYMAVLPDKRIVSGSSDGSIRVWDSLTGQRLQFLLDGHDYGVSCIMVLANGHIISGSEDTTLREWDPTSGLCLQILEGHEGRISCMEVLPDGKIVSGSYDRSLRVWDLSTGECLHILEGHKGIIECIEILPGGRIVSCSADTSLRVWDPASGKCLQILEESDNGGMEAVILPDGRVVVSPSDGSIRVWDPTSGQYLYAVDAFSEVVCCLRVLPDGRVAIGLDGGTLLVFNPASRELLEVLEGNGEWISSMLVLPDGRVAIGSSDGALRVWNSLPGQDPQVLNGHGDSVNCIALLQDGCIVSCSDDNTIREWNLNTGECIKIIRITEVDVSHMDLSSAVLTEDLAKMLWQNGAKISEADFEKYVRKH